MKDLKERMTRLEIKVDKIEEVNQSQNDCLTRIESNQGISKVIQENNLESLKEHIKGSQANSSRLRIMEDKSIKNAAFIKGSIWVISVSWGLLLVCVGLYFKFAE